MPSGLLRKHLQHLLKHTKETKGGIAMLDVHKFHAMTNEEHIAAGHHIDSTGSWVDPKDYISSYFADW